MKTKLNIIHAASALFAFSCFAVLPQTRAVCQDGCLTNNNTAQGDDALIANTTGFKNTAIGGFALSSNTTGGTNTANGFEALRSNSTGSSNTANGANTLRSNTTGSNNTASGFAALFSNSIGSSNTANGVLALANNTGGSINTASGIRALFDNSSGSGNTATGASALDHNRTGDSNTANGASALLFSTTGSENTAIGASALSHNTTGDGNTASGFGALNNNTTGGDNIALGSHAGQNLITGSNNIDIGNQGVAAEDNTIRIGVQGTQTKTFIAGITGAGVTGVPVKVNADGQLGVPPSSKRFKTEITPMDKTSEAILALKPVTFRYRKEIDPNRALEFGLVAEDVEKANPDLVARDVGGKVYTVRYDAVNAMLLNEFLKEHRKTEKLEATVVRQQKQIEALTAGLQKVSAELEVIKPAPQTVLNSH